MNSKIPKRFAASLLVVDAPRLHLRCGQSVDNCLPRRLGESRWSW